MHNDKGDKGAVPGVVTFENLDKVMLREHYGWFLVRFW